jgi:hypothetical protein
MILLLPQEKKSRIHSHLLPSSIPFFSSLYKALLALSSYSSWIIILSLYNFRIDYPTGAAMAAAPVSFLYAAVVKAAAMDGNLPMLMGNNNNTYGPRRPLFLDYLCVLLFDDSLLSIACFW